MDNKGLEYSEAGGGEGEVLSRAVATLRQLAAPLVIAAVCVAASQVNYLLFHTLAELFSIVIALTAWVVASTSRHFTRNHFMVYVALVVGWCAGIDLVHTLAYKGMQLLGTDSSNTPTQLWIAARFLQASALLASPLFLRRSVRVEYVHLGFGVIALWVCLWVFSGRFPDMFVEGKGLTPLKVYAEYVIIAMLMGSSALLWQRRSLMSAGMFLSMQAALAAMILSEFAFTRYVSVYGSANMWGHIFKIFAYWFVYLALVQSTLREPFSVLSRTASTYDAVPDPALVVQRDGVILQANQAAARFTGMASQDLIGRLAHPLFHAPHVSAAECPVCARMEQGDSTFLMEIERGGSGGAVECSVAPFSRDGRRRSYVQVVRDITERRRLVAERESLVHNLGERVKELRCLYAVSNLIEQHELDIPGLLSGVVEVLPSAFLHPELARAGVSSRWGSFGATPPATGPRGLEFGLLVHDETIGSVRVSYPDEVSVGSAPFLPEERELLETVAQRLGEAIERIQAAAQVKRLTYLYGMLSATNRAIVRCRNNEELLSHVFEALIRHSAFPMLFIATARDGAMPLDVVRSHGIDGAKLADLGAVLADPQSLVGQSFEWFSRGQVVWASLSSEHQSNPWRSYLREHGITARAIVPLMREGRLFGVVGLYAQGPETFDQAQLNLLDEMTADLGFALDGIAANERRALAEQRAADSEFRFSEVFELSPTPMQIQSISSGKLRALNRAHQLWLGYTAQDVPTMQDWMAHVYPEVQVREELMQRWQQDVQAANSGEAVASPEVRLRCKDGSERIARGSMTVVDDDAIVAWTDLTDIRRSEQALRDSEKHFRGMIEQTITGIYVVRDELLLYANPRFCEIVGQPADALLGQNLFQAIGATDQVREQVRAAQEKLSAGERAVSVSVSFHLQDGGTIELGLHATQGQWDGQTATVVMVQDITERRRAEEKIAGYVRQLESSMRGTLQAVSNMIDVRDPYTAGHERRVGEIAGAIAREMGWSEQRCQELELVGLVHDIGKIAVPVEILSKPGRLTAMEMALVRGHAQAGYDILKDVSFSFPVAEPIWQHHERLDGSGYPRGLKGDEIVPEARILAVADVLESIAAHRPYRPALGLEMALSELEKGRGTQFDPEVLDAVLRLLRDKGYTLPK